MSVSFVVVGSSPEKFKLVLRRFLKNRNREPWFLWPKQKGIKEGGIDSFKEPVPFKESVPQKESIPEEEPVPFKESVPQKESIPEEEPIP